MKFEDARFDQIYGYWLEKKGSRRAPSRADIDPLDFPKLLPNIFLFDVYGDPVVYRMRLAGTRIVEIMGRNCTGLVFEDIFKGDRAEKVRADYNKVSTEFVPVYSEITLDWMNKDYVKYYRLMLPLSNDDQHVNMMLGLTTFAKE